MRLRPAARIDPFHIPSDKWLNQAGPPTARTLDSFLKKVFFASKSSRTLAGHVSGSPADGMREHHRLPWGHFIPNQSPIPTLPPGYPDALCCCFNKHAAAVFSAIFRETCQQKGKVPQPRPPTRRLPPLTPTRMPVPDMRVVERPLKQGLTSGPSPSGNPREADATVGESVCLHKSS